MNNRIIFAFLIFIIGCGEPEPQNSPKFSSSNAASPPITISAVDSSALKDANVRKDAKVENGRIAITDTVYDKQKLPRPKTCDELLFSLIDKSSFNPDVKKFKYNIWVDSLSDGVAILKITMRNTELHEDRVISWLKLDFNMPKLTDITGDEPVELTFDTVVLKQIIKNCRTR